MKAILIKNFVSKLKDLDKILLMFFLPTIMGYFMYEDCLIDTFYLIDGYKLDAYVVKCENDFSDNFSVELVDTNGEHYFSEGSYYKQKKMYQKINAIGSHNIIRRSKFLDKWGYWERGELQFWDLLIHLVTVMAILLFYTVFLIYIKNLIKRIVS